MRCPFCRHPSTSVVDSRAPKPGFVIRRRRQCPACGKRFTTFERVAIAMPWIIKRGGGRVIYVDIFEKEKLYFLFAYPKNVQVNLTEQQKKIVRQMVEAIKGE